MRPHLPMSSSHRIRRHVFISHHHKDDAAVDRLTNLLAGRGYDFRNSSVRLKEKNKQRMERGEISERAIRRLLRMKITWSGTVIVLIGRQTHTRPWVEWEIEEAQRQGKRIVGVYEEGGTDAGIPEALEKYGSAIVAWNPESIVRAVDGAEHRFERSDGSERRPVHGPNSSTC